MTCIKYFSQDIPHSKFSVSGRDCFCSFYPNDYHQLSEDNTVLRRLVGRKAPNTVTSDYEFNTKCLFVHVFGEEMRSVCL